SLHDRDRDTDSSARTLAAPFDKKSFALRYLADRMHVSDSRSGPAVVAAELFESVLSLDRRNVCASGGVSAVLGCVREGNAVARLRCNRPGEPRFVSNRGTDFYGLITD